MDTVMKVLIGLCCLLFVILALLVTFFVKYKPSPRSRSGAPTETNGSSNRSRMAARWANMERGSRSTRTRIRTPMRCQRRTGRSTGQDQAESLTRWTRQILGWHRSVGTRAPPDPQVPSARPGWFGLDEPTSAGYNTRPDVREKSVNGDVLPMRATNGQYTEELHLHIPVVPHHRVPTTEDHDWETRSQGSNV
ncbi:hypothetical protein KEM48_013362 [Puccinia striiformis f. sp. tritici PST-130]|nr:hypothetical protein KEM48_013362 [Puccinia striiformis f. sp. tritici PST-130]